MPQEPKKGANGSFLNNLGQQVRFWGPQLNDEWATYFMITFCEKISAKCDSNNQLLTGSIKFRPKESKHFRINSL